MRTAAVLIILVGLGVRLAGAEPLEIPNDATTVREMRRDMASWKGKLVAMRVRVVEVHADNRGQPILKVAVGPGDPPETLWVGSSVKQKFSPGNDTFMLGLMTRRPDRSTGSRLSEVATDPFVVLGICFFNLTEKWGAGDEQVLGALRRVV